jgi:hypothetical protein
MVEKVQNELKKLINIHDITPELLQKLIHKIELKENKHLIIHYRFSNPFLVNGSSDQFSTHLECGNIWGRIQDSTK